MANQQRSDTLKVGDKGKECVGKELRRRGAIAYEVRGRKNIISAGSSNKTRQISIRVKSRNSGDWQIPWIEGRKSQANPDEKSFWILVDFTISKTAPDFYIMPDWWIRNDIYHHHHEWLQSHGGIRPVTPDSTHHRVTLDRIEEWKNRWEILKIY